MLIGEILPKLNQKTKSKTKGLIDKKPPKLNEKTRKKTNHLLLCAFVYERLKPFKI